MKLDGARVLLTGASGGIGGALLRELLARGARVAVTARDPMGISAALAGSVPEPSRLLVLQGDLTDAAFRASLPEALQRWAGGLDVLVNNAGRGAFALLPAQQADELERLLRLNLLVPMDLARLLLPLLGAAPAAAIVNVGSVVGAIGLAGNVAYSASKFGLRGFSEALRRELADTRVRVLHVAPRATRTRLNTAAVDALNERLGNAVDDPARVAAQVVTALERDRVRVVIGWPEKFFARLNALLPGVVDNALAKQLPDVKRAAASADAGSASASPSATLPEAP